MSLFNTVSQAYTLASPYFSPSQGNGGRIGAVVASIFMMAFRAKYDGKMRQHIYKVFDFFVQKKPIAEFSKVFRCAVVGFVSLMAVDMTGAFFNRRLNLSFQSAMKSATLQRWLKKRNYQGVKELDCELSKKICGVFEQRIPNFTSTTITLVIERVGDLAINFLTVYRIYHLSKPLYSKSLPFPLNCQGGVCAMMIGLLGLFSWIKVSSQEGIAKSHAAVNQKLFETLKGITFLESNALQVASLPAEYNGNILRDIQTKGADTLTAMSSHAISRFFNTHFTFIFPNFFQLSIVYLASLFAKADPEHFDYTNSFLPLFRECMTFMWKNTYFIQSILNDWLSYRQSVQEIQALFATMTLHEKQKKELAIIKGDKFSIQNLTITFKTDKGPETIFSHLDLNIEPGHLYFVRGGNGSGKTVLLKAIAGFQAFTQGTITVPEHVWYLQPRIEIDPMLESFSGILSKTFGIKNREEVVRVQSYLQRFRFYYSKGEWKIPEINEGSRNWATLSDGQKQVLNLAVVLAIMENITTPWLILGDEILGQVDNISDKEGPSARTVALDLLKQLASGSTKHTILIVDHNGLEVNRDAESEIKTSQDVKFAIYKLNRS